MKQSWPAILNWSYKQLIKSDLRETLCEKRSSVDAEAREIFAKNAARMLNRNVIFQTSQNIACYLPARDEFDTLPLIHLIWETHKKCFLPKLSAGEKTLTFVSYSSEDVLEKNRYNILEPQNTYTIPLQKLDLIIAPLVGFDLNGNRLGKGGGYYDRTLAPLVETGTKKPFFLGLAYEAQYVEELPRDEWDIPLDGILTEKRLLTFTSG